MKKRFMALLLLVMLMIPVQYASADIADLFKHAHSILATSTPRPAWMNLSMEITDKSTMYHENLSNNRVKVRIKITNGSSYTTIKAFELHLKARDVWGDYIYGDGVYYYWTTKKNVKPGETVYTDWITIPNRKEISKVEIAIKKEVDDCGVITEVPDNELDFWYWTVDW